MSQTGQAGTGCPGIAGMLGSRWLFARVVGRQFRDGVDVDPGDGPAGRQPARQVRRAGQEESGQAVRCTGVLVRLVECLGGGMHEEELDLVDSN